jgi:transcription elongation GreA/GreB family factor
MSVAFTREDSAEAAAEVELPERPISPHPNLVTAAGLELLKNAMAAANASYLAHQTIEDVNERRRVSATAARDLRYFTARVASAQLRNKPADAGAVSFGHQVTFERGDGRKQSYRIVGEDEADPAHGSISYVSPVARALMGKGVGDVVSVNGQDIEIVAIM